MLCECIQDLRTIQSKYPESSRGYESLRFAITILERAIDIEETVSPHWVLGQGAGSANGSLNSGMIVNPGAFSGTITVEPGEASFSVEYKDA